MADREEQGREALAEWFHQSTMECAHRGDVHECVLRARALLASVWLKAHDAEVAAAERESIRLLLIDALGIEADRDGNLPGLQTLIRHTARADESNPR